MFFNTENYILYNYKPDCCEIPPKKKKYIHIFEYKIILSMVSVFYFQFLSLHKVYLNHLNIKSCL